MPTAVGDYLLAIRDRLIALHEADGAWKGADKTEKTKVRQLNLIVRDGRDRQNQKRTPGFAAGPGDLPLADFGFLRLGPGPQQVNPHGAMRTFGNASADTPACGGVTTQSLVYGVSYRASTENVLTALATASQRVVTAARNQLAGTGLPALPYVTGAALVSARRTERAAGGVLVNVMDTEILVNVRLTTADITG